MQRSQEVAEMSIKWYAHPIVRVHSNVCQIDDTTVHVGAQYHTNRTCI